MSSSRPHSPLQEQSDSSMTSNINSIHILPSPPKRIVRLVSSERRNSAEGIADHSKVIEVNRNYSAVIKGSSQSLIKAVLNNQQSRRSSTSLNNEISQVSRRSSLSLNEASETSENESYSPTPSPQNKIMQDYVKTEQRSYSGLWVRSLPGQHRSKSEHSVQTDSEGNVVTRESKSAGATLGK